MIWYNCSLNFFPNVAKFRLSVAILHNYQILYKLQKKIPYITVAVIFKFV
jgi:hypothetical protein